MEPRMVCFDLETTNLRGNFGRILVASFVTIGDGDVITYRGDDKKFKKKDLADDSKLALAIKEYLERSWCWISWNGKMFDVPFLNTRLRLADLEPVEKRMHIDLMYYARRPNMSLNNSRLDTIAKTFELAEQKTDLTPKEWINAMLLDSKSIDYIVEHCEQDVKVLREAFPLLLPFIARVHK